LRGFLFPALSKLIYLDLGASKGHVAGHHVPICGRCPTPARPLLREHTGIADIVDLAIVRS